VTDQWHKRWLIRHIRKLWP